MRVGFAGTPEFAGCALAAIHRHGCTIPIVLTQPDRPFGRGLAVAAPPVKRYATEHGLPVRQPESLKPDTAQAALRATPLDVLVVAAYGLILPRGVLEWPRYGCLNIHASLLPRWRGAAPVARAIEAGDATSGITIMQMDAGLDTGPMLAQQALALGPRETAGTLHDRLAELGARMIVDALRALEHGQTLRSTPQPTEGVSYAAKISRPDTLVDWTQSAAALDRKIRALSPAPGAIAGWQQRLVKIRAAMPLEIGSNPEPAPLDVGSDREPAPPGIRPDREPVPFDVGLDREPGTIVAVGAQGIDVACGRGVLRVTELQPAAGRAMSASAFAAGRRVAPGGHFEPGR